MGAVAVLTDQRAQDVLAEYEVALAGAPLADQSRRAYQSRVAGYLTWLTQHDPGGDPLADPHARNHAVQEYQSWLKAIREARPSTVNAILTALDHFYVHLRLGAAVGVREEMPEAPPRALDETEQQRFLQAALARTSVRDQAIALALFFTGVRVAELVALDLTDIHITARRGHVLVRAPASNPARDSSGPSASSPAGNSAGTRERVIPLQRESRRALRTWTQARDTWPGADRVLAVFLNRRGGRLSTRSVDDLVVGIGRDAGIAGAQDDDRVTPQILRHTFGARLLRDGTDILEVSELLGHKRLDSTRRLAALAS
jgi:integrase/recombinase XerC